MTRGPARPLRVLPKSQRFKGLLSTTVSTGPEERPHNPGPLVTWLVPQKSFMWSFVNSPRVFGSKLTSLLCKVKIVEEQVISLVSLGFLRRALVWSQGRACINKPFL